MTQRAFICHSTKDSRVANKIVDSLEKSGIECWIAPRNISSGSTYAASIVKGIKSCSVFIFVFSKSSNNSDAVINEIEKANSLKIQIIPFNADKDDYSDALDYYLRSKQSVIAYERPIEDAIDELIRSIGLTPVRVEKQNSKKWILPAAISFILILCAVIYFLMPKMSSTPKEPVVTTTKVDTTVKKVPAPNHTVDPKVPKKFAELIIEPDDIPAITGVVPNNFFFVRKTSDGSVEYSSGHLGGGGSPWQLINNRKVTGSAPSAASIGNSIYLVMRDNNKNLLLCQGSFNASFGDWLSMNFGTDAKPAITAVGSAFYYFAKNSTGQVFYNYAAVSGAGAGWRQVDGNILSASAPSAGSVGNHVFVAVKGTNDKIYYNQADKNGSFNQNWELMDFTTKVAPTLIGVGNYIYIFAVKPNGEIWWNRAQLRQSFEGWKIVEGNGRTYFSVTAGTAGAANYIFLEMKGTDGNIYLNQGFDRFQNSWSIAR